MENKNYDLKLAGYIWSILKTHPVIVMSWGVDMDTIKPVKGGLEFHVQGFIHTGMVRIILDEGKDLFEIHLIPDSEGEEKIIEDVYLDMLVSVMEKYTEALDSVKYLKWHHDVGFMIGCSYLNGYRFADKKKYKDVIIETAKSLSTRFRPNAGVIQSWDADRGWQGTRGWKCPVIIDNMMNLELLFEATAFSGDSTFYNIAVKHADTTIAHHFRPDNSCYHVVDYDPETGEVRKRQTAQGYADESAWARGQAWALYGYTTCYRYTKDKKYLDQAQKVYNFIFNNKNLPEDLVPYWDYDAPNIPNEPRDASAAACTASALYELDGYLPGNHYKETADKIMESLGSPVYRAKVGTNGNFILMHSVGSIPHGQEIDVPLNYADYYFLEGLMRKRDLEKK